MQLHFDMDFSQWQHAFREIQNRARDTAKVHEEIGDYLAAETVGNVEAQGGDAYWPPLKPETLERRRREHPGAGDKMLIVTRELIDSITKDAHDAYVDVGSALRKARTLFFGRSAIPARFPFLWKAGVLSQVGRMYLEYFFTRLR